MIDMNHGPTAKPEAISKNRKQEENQQTNANLIKENKVHAEIYTL